MNEVVPRLGVLNTSIATQNAGDQIIVDAALMELQEVFFDRQIIQFPSHEKLSSVSRNLQKLVDMNIACGTNLLHSHMGLVKQWNVGLIDAIKLKPVILFGVGWRSHATRKTDFYTKFLLGKLLSKTHLHSVRDSYAEAKLKEIGFENVVNTGCPTLWRLDEDHCKKIPVSRGKNALVVLTDYSENMELDAALMDVVVSKYGKVYFWCQGMHDFEYLKKLGYLSKVNVIPSSLASYNALLSDSSISLDYVGTRLHGGIRALQSFRRTVIIGVDHRANSMGKDFDLPVIDRYEDVQRINKMISEDLETKVALPLENIHRWKIQFSQSV